MATTWLKHEPRINNPFLTAKGNTLHPRPMEITDSGRKVRFIGDAASSVFTKDEDDLILTDLETRASAIDDRLWLALAADPLLDEQHLRACFDYTAHPEATFHLVHPSEASRNRRDRTENTNHTTVWWRFRHPTLPLTAILVVDSHETRTNYYSNNPEIKQNVSVKLVRPEDNPRHSPTGHKYTILSSINGNSALSHELSFGQQDYDDDRLGAQKLLNVIRDIRENMTQLPLWNNGEQRDEMLDLVDTNANDRLEEEIADFLDGEKAVREIADLYLAMMAKMRQLGIVLPPKSANAFLASLIGGEQEATRIRVQHSNKHLNHYGDQLDGPEGEHLIFLDLISGSVSTLCMTPPKSDPNAMATDWEAAKLMAQLTGQEDELLAYARESTRRKHEGAVEQHIGARRNPKN